MLPVLWSKPRGSSLSLVAKSTLTNFTLPRLASPDQATVDLHGTTVAEATVIVKEILNLFGPSPCKRSLPYSQHERT